MPQTPRQFSAFRAALKHHNHGLSPSTWLRYMRGELPEAITWLTAHPHLLAALAADAQQNGLPAGPDGLRAPAPADRKQGTGDDSDALEPQL